MDSINFKTLDLNLLRVFDEVMTERSLTKAAHKLAITQPAVSNALRRLREALGDELIQRSGQTMAPTPRALALWPAVREALRQLQEVITPSHFVPGQANTTFVLAMADATAAELMPGLVEVMDRDAPGISVRVVPLTTRDPRAMLDAQHADLAVGYFPAAMADLTARTQAGEAVAFAHQASASSPTPPKRFPLPPRLSRLLPRILCLSNSKSAPSLPGKKMSRFLSSNFLVR